eukprot:3346010-Amphidinium_carterae.9
MSVKPLRRHHGGVNTDAQGLLSVKGVLAACKFFGTAASETMKLNFEKACEVIEHLGYVKPFDEEEFEEQDKTGYRLERPLKLIKEAELINLGLPAKELAKVVPLQEVQDMAGTVQRGVLVQDGDTRIVEYKDLGNELKVRKCSAQSQLRPGQGKDVAAFLRKEKTGACTLSKDEVHNLVEKEVQRKKEAAAAAAVVASAATGLQAAPEGEAEDDDASEHVEGDLGDSPVLKSGKETKRAAAAARGRGRSRAKGKGRGRASHASGKRGSTSREKNPTHFQQNLLPQAL